MNRKPMAPNNTAHIKTHEINKQIRPVINNIHAPYYKVENYLNKKLKSFVCLPNTYTNKNSYEIAQELKKLKLMRIIR
jgi:5-bromo-4-chloroindolyl phosphate hydrolysis protein